jgi:hypothetical protein
MILYHSNNLNYLKHSYLLDLWNLNLEHSANTKVKLLVLALIILTSKLMEKKSLYQAKLKILKFYKSQDPIQYLNLQLLDLKGKINNKHQDQANIK